jgi:hypothetical protein
MIALAVVFAQQVFQLQLYVVKDYIHLPDNDLQVLIMRELGRLIPEFAGAKVRKWALNRYWDLFTQ